MMFELLIVLLGTVAGIMAGLLSGIGAFATVLICYPFLLHLDPIHIILFYVCLITATQYVGSVVAIYLGIPGEATSMPSVIEGRRLYKRQMAHFAITNTALGSFIGGVLAIGFTLLILPNIMSVFELTWKNNFRFFLFVGVFLVIVLSSNKNIFVSVLQMIAGCILGVVGVHPLYGHERFTFGIPDLAFGIPEVSAVFAIFVLPILFKAENRDVDLNKLTQIKNTMSFTKNIIVFVRSIKSSLRGTVLGYFLGLVPGVGTILASNVSYGIEKKVSHSSLDRVTASETANNSGVFSMLLPFLVVGIPIVGSEAVIYELIVQKGFTFGLEHDVSGLVMSIVPWLLLVNIIMILVSWPLARYLIKIYQVPLKYVKIACLLLLAYTIFYVGNSQGLLSLHVISFLALLPLGYLFRNYNTLPLIVSFLMAEQLESIVIRQWLLYGF
tara:strand:+ start:49 stop:1371 length:1323 start_codon:yes stop_codon:yes gene_type:complete